MEGIKQERAKQRLLSVENSSTRLSLFPQSMSTSRPRKPSLLESFARPTLDPPARAPPQLFQPDSLEFPPTSHSVPSSSSHPAPKAIHGNYLNYYERRNVDPSLPDSRLSLIPRDWIKGKKVLDVGSNAGQVTIELARDYEAGKVTGVDIDKDLTRKAKGNRTYSFSLFSPFFSVRS